MIAEKQKFPARVLSVNAAAQYCGYSRAVVQYWIDSGQLDYEEVPTLGQKNRCRRIRKADLDDFLEMHRKRNGTSGGSRPKSEPLILLDR